MTPNDILCSGDTTVLIKAIRSLPWMPYLPLHWGDACLAPVAVRKGGLSWSVLSGVVPPCSAQLLPGVGWVHLLKQH